MMTTFFKYINLARPIILLGIILLNFFIFQSWPVGLIFGLTYIVNYGWIIGRTTFKQSNTGFQIIFGAPILFGLFISIYWLNFYVLNISAFLFVATVVSMAVTLEALDHRINKGLCPCIWILLGKRLKSFLSELKCKPSIGAYLILMAAEFYQLTRHASDATIASPWHLLSAKFFIIFFIATAILIRIILANQKTALFLTMIHAFLMSSVALFLYKIGYGYDPFIHYATEKLIMTTGTISPKPLFYIGHYSLIIFLTNLFSISLETMNKVLLPVAFSIFAPAAIFFGIKYGWSIKTARANLLTLAFLFLPLTYFISTTPQGLTNLLAIMIVFLSFPAKKEKTLAFLNGFLAVIAMMVHPFFGAPLFLFSAYCLIPHFNLSPAIQRIKRVLLIAAGICVFPAMFFVNAKLNGLAVSFTLPQWNELKSINLLSQTTHWRFVLDFIYLYGFNYKVLFWGAAIAGLTIAVISKRFEKFKTTALFAGIFLFNFLITRFFLNLDFMGTHDKLQFSQRILELANYFLAPFFLYAIYRFIKQVWLKRNNFALKFFTIIVFCIGLSSSLYFSYPIFDDYKNSKEYNVSESDIKAVRFINEHANGDYIVLANQMVGAAAIREFGFAKYYEDEFYYSMPNIGQKKLYPYYEKMVFEKPLRKNVEAAMKIAGVDDAYFVLNDYWTNSKKISEQAKAEADDYFSIDNGRNTIFYYTTRNLCY